MSKVWMITARFHPIIGGAESQAQRLSSALLQRNWAVEVLTRRHGPGLPGGIPRFELVKGIPVHRVWSRGGQRLARLAFLASSLWHLGMRGRRGIYHAHDTGTTAWIAIAAAYLFRGSSVVKLRTGRRAYSRRQRSLLSRWSQEAVFRLADRLVAVNQEVFDFLLELGVPGERISFVPNGVDVDYFRGCTALEKSSLRERLGIPQGSSVVLWVGRMEKVKGLDILLSSWAKLPHATRSRARLLLVGGGSERRTLQELSVRFRVHDSVAFIDETQGVRDVYACADIFVLPSRSEGLSNAMLEAMACGLPVISSRVGGAPEFIENGVNGFLFSAESDVELATGLAQILQARSTWKAMGDAGRSRVIEGASVIATATRMDELYRGLLA